MIRTERRSLSVVMIIVMLIKKKKKHNYWIVYHVECKTTWLTDLQEIILFDGLQGLYVELHSGISIVIHYAQSLYERSSIKRRARTKNMNMQNVPEALLRFSEMEQ